MVYTLLSEEFGTENVFMDVDTIEPGQDFVETLNRAVSICDVLAVLIGPMWLNIQDESGTRRLEDPNDFVRVEIAYALQQNKIVIPVLIQGASMPREADLPADLKALSRRQAVRIGDRAADDIKRVLIPSIKQAIQEYQRTRIDRRPGAREAGDESFSPRRSKTSRVLRSLTTPFALITGAFFLVAVSLALIFGLPAIFPPDADPTSPTTSAPTDVPGALTTVAPANTPGQTEEATDEAPAQTEPPTEPALTEGPPEPGPEQWTSINANNTSQLRLVRSWEEPHGGVRSLALSPDGYKLLTGSEDGTVSLWSLPDGALIRTFTGHQDQVWGVAYHPSGSEVASASVDGTLRFWRVADGSLASNPLEHGNPVSSVAYSPNGYDVASGDFDGLVRQWSRSGDFFRALEGHTGTVISLAFSPDGQILASASSDGSLRLWQASDGVPLRTLTAGQDGIATSIAFSPDGSTLASAGEGPVRLWRVADGALLRTLDLGVTGSEMLWSIAFSPDGSLLAVGGATGAVHLVRVSDGRLLRILEHSGTVSSMAFAPNLPLLAIGCSDWNVYVWGIE